MLKLHFPNPFSRSGIPSAQDDRRQKDGDKTIQPDPPGNHIGASWCLEVEKRGTEESLQDLTVRHIAMSLPSGFDLELTYSSECSWQENQRDSSNDTHIVAIPPCQNRYRMRIRGYDLHVGTFLKRGFGVRLPDQTVDLKTEAQSVH